jgi:hypothetical protein
MSSSDPEKGAERLRRVQSDLNRRWHLAILPHVAGLAMPNGILKNE